MNDQSYGDSYRDTEDADALVARGLTRSAFLLCGTLFLGFLLVAGLLWWAVWHALGGRSS